VKWWHWHGMALERLTGRRCADRVEQVARLQGELADANEAYGHIVAAHMKAQHELNEARDFLCSVKGVPVRSLCEATRDEIFAALTAAGKSQLRNVVKRAEDEVDKLLRDPGFEPFKASACHPR
jgi:hypothetical protein